MPRATLTEELKLIESIVAAHPSGIGITAIEAEIARRQGNKPNRRTLQRRLQKLTRWVSRSILAMRHRVPRKRRQPAHGLRWWQAIRLLARFQQADRTSAFTADAIKQSKVVLVQAVRRIAPATRLRGRGSFRASLCLALF
jgi:hypothetical protein